MQDKNSELYNSIIFDCFGAIDFSEQIHIELSLDEKEEFVEAHPLDLLRKINEIKHIQEILNCYFYRIANKIPRVFDKNENFPKEQRFTKIYYKCYRKFLHSHNRSLNYSYTSLTLEDALDQIKKENFSIKIPIGYGNK